MQQMSPAPVLLEGTAEADVIREDEEGHQRRDGHPDHHEDVPRLAARALTGEANRGHDAARVVGGLEPVPALRHVQGGAAHNEQGHQAGDVQPALPLLQICRWPLRPRPEEAELQLLHPGGQRLHGVLEVGLHKCEEDHDAEKHVANQEDLDNVQVVPAVRVRGVHDVREPGDRDHVHAENDRVHEGGPHVATEEEQTAG
mmetsp:Transcript_8640/g.27060  ORF Transcript_8640/g.27060 Transcript_8640/m.27060 type:complete len:200 (-) Transcript_8640:527-1126(-)